MSDRDSARSCHALGSRWAARGGGAGGNTSILRVLLLVCFEGFLVFVVFFRAHLSDRDMTATCVFGSRICSSLQCDPENSLRVFSKRRDHKKRPDSGNPSTALHGSEMTHLDVNLGTVNQLVAELPTMVARLLIVRSDFALAFSSAEDINTRCRNRLVILFQ